MVFPGPAIKYLIFLLALVHFMIFVTKQCCYHTALCFYSLGVSQVYLEVYLGKAYPCQKKTPNIIFVSLSRRKQNRTTQMKAKSGQNILHEFIYPDKELG